MAELFLWVQVVVEVQFSSESGKQPPPEVGGEEGEVVREGGGGFWARRLVVNKVVGAGVESGDEQSHISTVVIEVEE